MHIAALEFSFGELAAALTVLTMLGGAFIWLLAQKFSTKKLVYVVTDKLKDDLSARLALMEEKIDATHEMTQACNQRHELAKEPFSQLVKSLAALETSISTLNNHGQQRHESFMLTMAAIDKRVTVIEVMSKRRSRTGAGR